MFVLDYIHHLLISPEDFILYIIQGQLDVRVPQSLSSIPPNHEYAIGDAEAPITCFVRHLRDSWDNPLAKKDCYICVLDSIVVAQVLSTADSRFSGTSISTSLKFAASVNLGLRERWAKAFPLSDYEYGRAIHLGRQSCWLEAVQITASPKSTAEDWSDSFNL